MRSFDERATARPTRVVDHIAARLQRAGVRHVFGVGGANIEDLFAAIQRRRPELRVVLTKHEHGAGTAADAYARIGGGLGVVLATSGGGAMNLVHALAEARASGAPVLALVGEPPLELQGRGAFQDTSGKNGAIDALRVFRAVSIWCERAVIAEGVPAQLDRAIGAAFARRGPAVLLLEKNVQCAALPLGATPPAPLHERTSEEPAGDRAASTPSASMSDAVLRLAAGPVLVIAGEQVAREGGVAALARLVERLDARVAVTPDGRDAFDNAHVRFIGLAGAMGHAAAARALEQAAVCLLVGTRLPLLARQGLETLLGATTLVSLGRGRPFGSERQAEAVALHLEGSITGLCDALAQALPERRPREGLKGAGDPSGRSRPGAASGAASFDMAGALACVSRALPEGAVVLADAGNTGASVAHHVDLPRRGRSLIAMGMAGMGYTFGAAIGAACASGQRCVVCAGDGAFFMHGMEVHTAVEHELPITFIIFNNRAHGMCLMRERLLVGEEHDYNTFKEAHIGAAFAVLFPGLTSRDCRSLDELEQALNETAREAGPVLLAIELPEVEVPPFAALQAAAERLGRAQGKEAP